MSTYRILVEDQERGHLVADFDTVAEALSTFALCAIAVDETWAIEATLFEFPKGSKEGTIIAQAWKEAPRKA